MRRHDQVYINILFLLCVQEHFPVSNKKFSELYLMLFRKGAKAFENLLAALKSTGNDAAYEILTANPKAGAVQNTSSTLDTNDSDFAGSVS